MNTWLLWWCIGSASLPCNSDCGDFLHPEIPLFYQGVCRNPRRPITVAVKEERGSKGVGTRSFGRVNPCKWGGKHDWLGHKTVGVLSSTQWHVKNVKRGSLNQSTTCGSGRRNDRGYLENHGSFQLKCFEVLRYDKASSLGCKWCSYMIYRRTRVYWRF